MQKQVDKEHYDFQRYMSKARWSSIWHQLDEVLKLRPQNVLEIGPGAGVFKAMAQIAGIRVETLDIDPDLKPDYVGPATAIPLPDGAFDVVCAFQVLEHLPYEQSIQAFEEMVRVSRKYLVISLPDSKYVWPYSLFVPKYGKIEFHVKRPFARIVKHIYDGEHYWEINKLGYSLLKIIEDFTLHAELVKTYRIHQNPYHRIFIFKNTIYCNI